MADASPVGTEKHSRMNMNNTDPFGGDDLLNDDPDDKVGRQIQRLNLDQVSSKSSKALNDLRSNYSANESQSKPRNPKAARAYANVL